MLLQKRKGGSELLFILILILLSQISKTISIAKTNQVDIDKSSVALTSSAKETKMATAKIYGCDFEIFGKVQGVFFRKYTDKQAKQLGLRGWCMNTHEGTVRGQLEGPQNELNEMKHWLRTKGSPKSRIDKANISEMKEIPDFTFKSFVVKR